MEDTLRLKGLVLSVDTYARKRSTAYGERGAEPKVKDLRVLFKSLDL